METKLEKFRKMNVGCGDYIYNIKFIEGPNINFEVYMDSNELLLLLKQIKASMELN